MAATATQIHSDSDNSDAEDEEEEEDDIDAMRSMSPVAAALTSSSSSSQPPQSPAGQQETDMHAQRPDQRPDGREHSVISSIHDTTNTTDTSSNPSSNGGSSSHRSSSEHSSDSRSSSSDSSRPIPESSSNVPGGYPEFNQNYDEQSDSSYPARDGAADVDDDDDDDGLFDDDEDADEKAKRIAIAAAAALQNDRGQSDDDDDYDYDYGEPAKPPTRHVDDDDSSFRSDDSKSSSSSFSSRRKTATKLGLNDAIKFIDTPHGKAGFVYQAPAVPAFADGDAKAKGSKAGGAVDVFDDDDDDEAGGFARRKTVPGIAASGHEAPKQRITPVLTADGKVALLYRGASDSGSTGKYEPIRNLTSYEEPAASTDAPATTVVEYTTLTLQTSTTSTTSTTTVHTTTTTATFVGGRLAAIGGGDNTEENAILPNINRPLSEVLGIKKNQFTQFRIADHGQPGVPAPPPQLPPMDFGGYRQHAVEEPLNRLPDETVMRSESHRPASNGDQQHSQIAAPPALRPSYDDGDQDDPDNNDLDPNYTDALSKTEVVNLAIIPAFDSDLLAIQEQEDRRAAAEAAENGYGGEYGGQQRTHYRHRTTQTRRKAEDLSAIHCAMQAMVAIAALATVFGMLGAYFKTRVLDQLQLQHWWEMVGVRYWVGLSRRGGVVL